ncbi:MAG: hypothetical protein ACMUEL_01320 [Flavobacteriales bacterium Tduv]
MNYIIKRFTRRSKFFKRLNRLIHWKGMEKEIRKNILKRPRNKSQPAYSGISLFTMIPFELLV